LFDAEAVNGDKHFVHPVCSLSRFHTVIDTVVAFALHALTAQ
jgi:hypothetical protein